MAGDFGGRLNLAKGLDLGWPSISTAGADDSDGASGAGDGDVDVFEDGDCTGCGTRDGAVVR